MIQYTVCDLRYTYVTYLYTYIRTYVNSVPYCMINLFELIDGFEKKDKVVREYIRTDTTVHSFPYNPRYDIKWYYPFHCWNTKNKFLLLLHPILLNIHILLYTKTRKQFHSLLLKLLYMPLSLWYFQFQCPNLTASVVLEIIFHRKFERFITWPKRQNIHLSIVKFLQFCCSLYTCQWCCNAIIPAN